MANVNNFPLIGKVWWWKLLRREREGRCGVSIEKDFVAVVMVEVC